MDDRYQDPDARTRSGVIRLRLAGDRAELADAGPMFQLGSYGLRRPLVVGRVGVLFEATGDPDEGFSMAAVHVPLANFQDDSTFVEHYLGRAARCKALHHPNLVATWESGENGLLWRAMELIGGSNLVDIFQHQRRPPLWVVLRVLTQLADCLRYLHGRGMVHRRIAPQRLRLTLDWQLKLCGLATVEPENLELDPAEMCWRSPESLDGESGVASDVYQLGLIGLYLMAGVNPLQRVTIPQTVRAVSGEVPPMPVGVPRALADVLVAAMEKRPSNRPNLAEIIDRLGRVDPGAARPWPVPDSPPAPVPMTEIDALRQRFTEGRPPRRAPPPPPPLVLPAGVMMPSLLSAPPIEMRPPPELGVPSSDHTLNGDDDVTAPRRFDPASHAADPMVTSPQTPLSMLLYGLALGVVGGLATAALIASGVAVGWWLVHG